jgi:uncharacterized protein (DUF1810 family)
MSQVGETTDRFNLGRFTSAQQQVYEAVRAELKSGRKRTHWIWFIFPQVDGLGHSSTAKQYAIKSRDEAVAYLATPLLAARLIECTKLVLAVPQKSAHDIFGSPDDMKFRSSMTLFDAVDGGNLYRQAIDRFYGCDPDPATLAILKEWREDAANKPSAR